MLMLDNQTLVQFQAFCERGGIMIHDQARNDQSTENLFFDLYRGEFDGTD